MPFFSIGNHLALLCISCIVLLWSEGRRKGELTPASPAQSECICPQGRDEAAPWHLPLTQEEKLSSAPVVPSYQRINVSLPLLLTLRKAYPDSNRDCSGIPVALGTRISCLQPAAKPKAHKWAAQRPVFPDLLGSKVTGG